MTRRELLSLGATFALAQLVPATPVRVRGMYDLRIGTVLPSRTGEATVRASIYDHAGDAARMGAVLALERLRHHANAADLRLDVLAASSPTEEAAYRAARRLVVTEQVGALIGGIGTGQAEVIGAVADAAGIPFLNIGSSSDALRHAACRRSTFHVEASAAMYLDATAAWHAARGARRWFFVYEGTGSGRALYHRGLIAVAGHGAGGEVVGSAAALPGQATYTAELAAIRSRKADVIHLLLDAVDQISFLAQQESKGISLTAATYPHVVTQTRDYIAAARHLAPATSPGDRIALWETTADLSGAADFNDRYRSRWGAPADPTAWASYQAVGILVEAALATGTADGGAIIEFLESPQAVFDLGKGPETSFRPWDHQLRQPLHVIQVDRELEWDPRSLSSRIDIARFAGELPDRAGHLSGHRRRLDRFGDGPDPATCDF